MSFDQGNNNSFYFAEDLNGDEYCAVKLDSQEIMTIGYIVRKGVTISPLGQKYLEEIEKYKDRALS